MQIISIKDFLITGNFGGVRIGITEAEIIQLLGEPCGYGNVGWGKHFHYGKWEFFFDENCEPRLYGIQNDNYEPKQYKNFEFKNEHFKLKTWPMRRQKALTVTEVLDKLNHEKLTTS